MQNSTPMLDINFKGLPRDPHFPEIILQEYHVPMSSCNFSGGDEMIKDLPKPSCAIKGNEAFDPMTHGRHMGYHMVPTKAHDAPQGQPKPVSRVRESKYPVVVIKKLGSEDANEAEADPEGSGTLPTSTASTSGLVDPSWAGLDPQEDPPLPERASFRCFQCNFATDHKPSLKTHSLIHSETPTKLFKCSDCSFETNWQYNFKNHAEIHVSSGGFRCTECQFDSSWKDKFDYHLLSHASAAMLKCEECDFESNWRNDFDRHLGIHSGTKRFKCGECEFETNWKNEFLYHLLAHTNAKIFKCDECGFKTSRKGNLTRHLLIHSTAHPKRFMCDQCEFTTHWKYKLKAHSVTHLDDIPKLFKCDDCKFETHRKGNLTRHRLIHSTAAKRLTCAECSYKTHWNYKLTAHMLKHSERGGFECVRRSCKTSAKKDVEESGSPSPDRKSPV